jgi:hypothetical protein
MLHSIALSLVISQCSNLSIAIQGLDGCFERNKSCLSTCDEGTYNKKLYGWLGALHRQLQRSHYQIRYGRPVQLIVLALTALMICKSVCPILCFLEKIFFVKLTEIKATISLIKKYL